MNNSMVSIKDLKFTYNKHNRVLDVPSWDITRSDMVFLAGKSGSGKSTLIHILSGLLEPDQGSVIINGTKLGQLKPAAKNRFRANHIGLISQQFNLIPYLSVMENIELAQSFQNGPSGSRINEVRALMEQLELDATIIHQRADELSVGQQQRVAIIRAIINQPELVLADEPTSALDQDAKDSFIQVLKQVVSEHKMTLLFISHDQTLQSHFPTNLNMVKINAV